MVSTVMDHQQISALSDDELYAKLQEMGGTIGPIVASTRSVYERQLFKILHEISVFESSHESGDEPEHNIPVDDLINSPDSFSPCSTSSPQTVFGTNVEFRHRPIRSYAEASDGIYFDRTSLARNSYRSDLQNTRSNEVKFHYTSKQSPSTLPLQQPKKMPIALLVVVAFVIILVILVYFNMESSNTQLLP